MEEGGGRSVCAGERGGTVVESGPTVRVLPPAVKQGRVFSTSGYLSRASLDAETVSEEEFREIRESALRSFIRFVSPRAESGEPEVNARQSEIFETGE